MYFPDLSTTCQLAQGADVRAIGWLERDHAFPTAPPDAPFVAALQSHLSDPGRFLPVVSCGPHFCDLGSCERAAGAQGIIIPAPACVYVAPDLLVHYVEHHHYAPPAEFVAAVLACPEQCSDAYIALLLPFAGVWRLSEPSLRRIAAQAPERRRAHAEAVAEHEASKGSFRW